MEDYKRLGDGRVWVLLFCFPNLVNVMASLTRLYIINLQLHYPGGNYTARGVLLHSPSPCLTLFTSYYRVHGSRNIAAAGCSYCILFVVHTG